MRFLDSLRSLEMTHPESLSGNDDYFGSFNIAPSLAEPTIAA